jgi:hypothetical protein
MIDLIILGILAFIQNMSFTLSGRSRSSADPRYHRWCAWGSNGIWFACQMFIIKSVWASIHAGDYWYVLAAGAVYTLCTAEGSVTMMKYLIKTEKGDRRVGATIKTTSKGVDIIGPIGYHRGDEGID